MANTETFTLRPRKSVEGDFHMIAAWCRLNDRALSDVFNAYLPAIAHALQNSVHEHDDKTYVRSDFGDIRLLKRGEFEADEDL